MTRTEYLVSNPYEVEKADIPLLKKEVEKHPYFYTMRALLLFGLKNENHPSFEDYLNKTSIYSNDRSDLYYYINSERVKKTNSVEENNISEDLIDLSLEDEMNNFTGFNDFEIKNDEVENIESPAIDLKDDNSITNFDENRHLNPVNETLKEEIIDIEDLNENTIDIASFQKKQEQNIIVIQQNLKTETINDSLTEIEDRQVFDQNITLSFSDWLKKFPSEKSEQDNQLTSEEEEKPIDEREIKYKLIDDFLEKNPKPVPVKKTDVSHSTISSNFSKNSEEYSDLMTETLAQIYIEQKKYDKAVKAYKILILKYPEKSSLFANQIKEIDNLKNSK